MNIKEIKTKKENEKVIGDFLVIESNVMEGKTKYLNGKLSDGEFEIGFKIWDYKFKAIPKGTPVKIEGIVNIYNGIVGVIVNKISKSELPIEKFYKKGPNDIGFIKSEIEFEVNSIYNKVYKDITRKFFELYGDLFYYVPAACSHHHNYIHGNAQHSFEVLSISTSIARSLYEYAKYNLDTELIAVGALLHDMGKVNSYKFEDGICSMTNTGQFVDHIVSGLQMLDYIRRECDIEEDNEDYLKLCHIIASHHGKLEFGSPVKPKFSEALIVNFADDISAKVCMMEEENNQLTDTWSDKPSYIFGTRIFNMER